MKRVISAVVVLIGLAAPASADTKACEDAYEHRTYTIDELIDELLHPSPIRGAYEAAESSTKLALEATQLGYKVGVRVNLDVLNAQTQLYTTQRDLAKARYDVVVNGLKLRQASGQLRPEDVSAVNTLLVK